MKKRTDKEKLKMFDDEENAHIFLERIKARKIALCQELDLPILEFDKEEDYYTAELEIRLEKKRAGLSESEIHRMKAILQLSPNAEYIERTLGGFLEVKDSDGVILLIINSDLFPTLKLENSYSFRNITA